MREQWPFALTPPNATLMEPCSPMLGLPCSHGGVNEALYCLTKNPEVQRFAAGPVEGRVAVAGLLACDEVDQMLYRARRRPNSLRRPSDGSRPQDVS